MEKEVKLIHDDVSNTSKRIIGKAYLLKKCNDYIRHCGGWNPLVEESLKKDHAEIIKLYSIFTRLRKK